MTGERRDFRKAMNQARVKSEDFLGRKVRGLERLLEISQQICTLELPVALDLIVGNIMEMTGALRGMVMLLDKKGELTFEHAVNLSMKEVACDDFEISRSISKRAITSKDVIIVEDIPSSASQNQNSVLRLGLMAVVVIPLRIKDRIIGIIYADTDSREHQLSTYDISIFRAFGAQAAIAIENVRLYQNLKRDYLFLRRPEEGSFQFDMIVYQSQGMHRVRQLIQQVLDADIPVLILGESGTGKELVAHALHFQGSRKAQKFVALNMGALPDGLIESELFGHKRGAFSGAVNDKAGLFEVANGGTIFLDELGEASQALQVRLLRLLETRKFRRVGDTVDRDTDVRVIAATHQDLEARVATGAFRKDLYYRLSAYPIRIPPLKERREDIPLLINHFLGDFNQKLGKSINLISKKTMLWLQERDWPGNIRELKNFIYRHMILSPGEELILEDELFEPIAAADHCDESEGEGDVSELKTMQEVEREYIRFVLDKVNGNKAWAARVLGLPRGTFRSRLKKLGIMQDFGDDA